jgi:hypothetical protein
MARFKISLQKIVYASYEITTNTDDEAVVERAEEEKLKLDDEYEESLGLKWDLYSHLPEIRGIAEVPSDETAK